MQTTRTFTTRIDDAVAGLDTGEEISDRLAVYGRSVRAAIDAGARAGRRRHGRFLHRGLARDRRALLVRRSPRAALAGHSAAAQPVLRQTLHN